MITPLASVVAILTTDASPFWFPYELLGEIFTHCDVPTLASLSRVSFACLELTAKLLYTDITLSDAKSIIRLLRLTVSVFLTSSLPDR